MVHARLGVKHRMARVEGTPPRHGHLEQVAQEPVQYTYRRLLCKVPRWAWNVLREADSTLPGQPAQRSATRHATALPHAEVKLSAFYFTGIPEQSGPVLGHLLAVFMYINLIFLFCSLASPAPAVSPHHRDAPAPSAPLLPPLDPLTVLPALMSPEPNTSSRRCPRTGPRADLRPYPPSATHQRALQGDRTLGEGGWQRENPGKSPSRARPRHSRSPAPLPPPLPAPARTEAEPRMRSRLAPAAPLMAAPRALLCAARCL